MVEQEAPEVTDFHRRTNEHKIAFLRAVVQALHGNILPLDNYMKLNDVSRMNEPDFDFKAFEYISSVAAKIVFNELLGYGVPTSEVLDMAMKYQPLVEVGAGTGLIAKLLQDKGCKIVASDPYHEDCPYKFKVNRFGNVIKAFGPEAIRRYHARNVLIVWPSLGEPWGTACLKAMKSGRIVVYMGEIGGGCCADDSFFETLEEDFEELESCRLPNFTGIRNHIWAYRKM